MIANRSDQITRPLVYMLWAIFIFNKSTIYQEEISKLPPYFILQKYIKMSTWKLYQFFIHRNCIEEVRQNDVKFSAIEITSNKVHWNDVDFSYIEITWNKSCQNDVNFLPIKVIPKKFVEMIWLFVDIFFLMHWHNTDIDSMSTQRVVSVGY